MKEHKKIWGLKILKEFGKKKESPRKRVILKIQKCSARDERRLSYVERDGRTGEEKIWRDAGRKIEGGI